MDDDSWSAERKDRWWTVVLVSFVSGMFTGMALAGVMVYWAIKWATTGS